MPVGKRWVKGQSGNPAGRPREGESWAAIVKAVGEMDVDSILAMIGTGNELGKAIGKLPRRVQIKYLVTVRVFAALMFEPTAGLWIGLMDRAEGKVPERVKFENSLTVGGLEEMLDKVYGGKKATEAIHNNGVKPDQIGQVLDRVYKERSHSRRAAPPERAHLPPGAATHEEQGRG